VTRARLSAANDNRAPLAWRRALASPWLGHALVAGLALAVIAGLVFDQPFWITFSGRIAVFALAALALSFVLGQGGLVSFGHAAFMGLGAYAVGISAEHGLGEALFVLPLAALAGAGYAALTGLIALRTRGVYFIMITLAFAQMAYFVFTSLSAYGGDDGLTLWSRPTLAGTAALENDATLALVIIASLGIAYAALLQVLSSPFGLTLRGLKENEARGAALGIDGFRIRLIAYALSGALTALAGAYLALTTEFVAPAYMHWSRSGELIVMVVLGGVGSLGGAVLGAAVLLLLEEGLAQVTQYWKFWLGLILIALVLIRVGALRPWLSWLRNRLRRGPTP
jgi:branched-chain amino acid transport system permease protein